MQAHPCYHAHSSRRHHRRRGIDYCLSLCMVLMTISTSPLLIASALFVQTRIGNNLHHRRANVSMLHAVNDSSSDNSKKPFSHKSEQNKNIPSNQRRAFFFGAFSILSTTALLTFNPNSANAACLPGDIRSECIGIYKLPLDDGVLKYVETEEMLKKFAPDLNWVSCSDVVDCSLYDLVLTFLLPVVVD